MILYNTNKKEDGQVAIFTCGKIAYTNPKRRANLAEVIFGFRMLSENHIKYVFHCQGCFYFSYILDKPMEI